MMAVFYTNTRVIFITCTSMKFYNSDDNNMSLSQFEEITFHEKSFKERLR